MRDKMDRNGVRRTSTSVELAFPPVVGQIPGSGVDRRCGETITESPVPDNPESLAPRGRSTQVF